MNIDERRKKLANLPHGDALKTLWAWVKQGTVEFADFVDAIELIELVKESRRTARRLEDLESVQSQG